MKMKVICPKECKERIAKGENVEIVDVMGNDAFMYASAHGRPKNLQCWLERIKDWDLNRQNTIIGSFAVSVGVYQGPKKIHTVKALVSAGALLDYRTFSGSSVLTNAVDNEDSDPDVVRFLLETLKGTCSDSSHFKSIVNYRCNPSKLKRKAINFAARSMFRAGISKSTLIAYLAIKSGTTALNLAVVRGDVEIVKILLENGADPYVENDLGMNAFDICNKAGPFPSVNRALQKHVNEE